VRVGHLNRLMGRAAVPALLLGLLPLFSPAPALAVLAAPSNLSPDSEPVGGMPVLSWTRVTSAATYDVQISTQADFNPTVYSASTQNSHATPTSNLPTGSDLYWRVRGVTSAHVAGAWATASFTHDVDQGPALISPDSGAQLQEPDDTPLLTWAPVGGAASYTYVIGTDDQFVGATPHTTKSTGVTFESAAPATTYYWRVQANFSPGDLSSDWSETRTFQTIALPAPQLVAPDDSSTTQIQDAVLDWAPVPGAVRYELQVSTDDQFNTTVINLNSITGTRYAKPSTIANDQYWWRVRGIDANGAVGAWSTSLNQFQRNWPDQANLVYPADESVVSSQLFYEWDGVPHASSYQLEVGNDSSFSPGHYETCTTNSTTYTPGRLNGACDASGDTTYWRVRPIDNPAGVNGVYSEIHSFTYAPGSVTQLSPADGATVEIPTLTWESYPSAETYRVIVKRANGTTASTATTEATSWTPTGSTRLDPDDGPFHWTVQATLPDLSSTSVPLFGFDWTFNVTGTVTDDPDVDGLTPTSPPSTHGVRPPTLTWEPWFDSTTPATYYQIFVGHVGSGSVTQLGGSLRFPYSAGSDDTVSTPGDYYWFARAYNSLGATLGTGPNGYFTIDPLATVSGRALSLTGVGLQSPDSTCARSLPASPTTTDICSNLQQTPVLSWDPVPDAAYYMVYIGRDRELTNMVYSPTLTTQQTVNTIWTPTDELSDSQAGTAYYWFIRPCTAEGICASDPTKANNAFDKRSNPVGGLTETEHESSTPLSDHGPGGDTDPPQFADEIVLSWDDYLSTSQAGNDKDVTGIGSQVEARTYRVEISSDPNFSPSASYRLPSGDIDQTSYTPATQTLPEGTLYWRVQAVDGSGNLLAWSLGRGITKAPAIQKKSPTPVLSAPINGETVNGTPAFSWEPLAYAAKYDVQVARNGDTTFSGTLAATGTNLLQTTYVPNVSLATSGNPYVWRVRRIDASSRPGAWSQPETFSVSADAPALLSPNAGVYVSSNDAIFEWGPVDGSPTYNFQRRAQGSTTLLETITTTGLAWAPQKAIPDGKFEWRVTSIDSSHNVIAASPWRQFRVDGTAPTVVHKTPLHSGTPTSVVKVDFSERVTGVGSSSFKIFPKGSAAALSATVTVINKRKSATLDPAKRLKVGSSYVIKLLQAIKDDAGNRLKPVSWTIKIKAA
jgi:hypothetical protein